MESIGIRELRQHASRWLARVRQGESFDVTDHGRTVARLIPAPRDQWDRLIASGEIALPESELDIADDDIVTIDGDFSASARLGDMRDAER